MTEADKFTPDQIDARSNAALKRLMGAQLSEADWDALELGPFDGDIVIKRPAIAIEARSDTTGTGVAEGESAGLQGIAENTSPPGSSLE